VAIDLEGYMWKGLTSLSVIGLVGGFRWANRISSKQQSVEEWREGVDAQLQKGDKTIAETHDAVIVLQTQMEGMTKNVEEIKKDQKTILERLTALIGHS